MGAFIAQELMLARPELVSAAVLMGTRGRMDRAREFFRDAEDELDNSGIQLPSAYDAKIRLLENFSRKTLNDDVAVADWIAMFSTWPTKSTPGTRCQLNVAPHESRLPAYRNIAAPVLVIGFSDDVLTPPYLGREVVRRAAQRPLRADTGCRPPRVLRAAGGRQRRCAAVLRRRQNLTSATAVPLCMSEPLDDAGQRRR